MKNLARQGCTHEQVYNALHAVTGTKTISFRYELLRNGIRYTDIDVLSASVSFDKDAQICRTARLEIGDSVEIDWLTDTIKPYMMLKIPIEYSQITVDWKYINQSKNSWQKIHRKKYTWADIHNKKYVIKNIYKWIEYPLGVFIPSTPTQMTSNKSSTYSVEAYDKTVILKEDGLTDRLFLAQGTSYINAVKAIMLSAGISEVMGDNVTTSLPTDREFEIGKSKLDVINTLLSEINFEPITVDAEGMFTLTKYVEPTEDGITCSYVDNQYSVVYNECTSETEFYSVPNVFLAVVSNPELKSDIKSMFVNDNPTNRLSTVRRKRNIVSEIYRPDVISSQADLDEYVRKIAFDKSQVLESVSFDTDLIPIHERSEVIELRNGSVSGIYVEASWQMELSINGKMNHNARRYIAI